MSKFKMPSAYTILFLIIIVVAILTWIVPAGTYEYVDPENGAESARVLGNTRSTDCRLF